MDEETKRDDSLEVAHGSVSDDILMSENDNDCINETVKAFVDDIGKPSASQSPSAKGDYSQKISFQGDITEPSSSFTSANIDVIKDIKRDPEIWSTETIYDNAADSSWEYIEVQPDITSLDENLEECVNQSTNKIVCKECSVILEKYEMQANEMQYLNELTDSGIFLTENLCNEEKIPLNKIPQKGHIERSNISRQIDESEVPELNGAEICHEEMLKDRELIMHTNSLKVRAACNIDADNCLGMHSSSLSSFVGQNGSQNITDNVALDETAKNDAKSEYIKQWLETTPIGKENLLNVHEVEKGKKHTDDIDMDVTAMPSTEAEEFDFVKEFCESIDISKNATEDHDFGLKIDNCLTEFQSPVSKSKALANLKTKDINDIDSFSDAMQETSTIHEMQETNKRNEKFSRVCSPECSEVYQSTRKSPTCISKCKNLALNDMLDDDAQLSIVKTLSENSENSVILEEEAATYDDILFKNVVQVFKQLNNNDGSTLTEIMQLLKHKYPKEQKSKLVHNLQSFLNRGVDIGFLIRKRRRYLLLEMNAKKEDISKGNMKTRKHRSTIKLSKSETDSRQQHLKTSKKKLKTQSRKAKHKAKFPQFKSRSLGKNLPKRKSALVARYRIRRSVIFNRT